ncbi:glycosyltransferase, partial [Bacillus subtilis]
AGLTFRLHRDIVSVHQEHPSNCKSVDDIRANIAYMCDKYNNIRSLDVHLAFNGPFPPDMTNGIMTDIHKLLESQKYDMLLNLFLELLHVVKERNIDPDWQKKAPRVTAKNFDLQSVRKLLPKAKKKLGVNDFANALYALVNDLLHVDLR